MSKPIFIFNKVTSITFLLLILLMAVPVYSGPNDKGKQPQGYSTKVLPDQECGKGGLGQDDSKCVPKEAGTAKKKIVKKAGTAAAVGVTGKKVSSGIGDKISGD